jgi:hypothetical protein
VDATIQAVYGTVLASSPATILWQLPRHLRAASCAAQARALFDGEITETAQTAREKKKSAQVAPFCPWLAG